MCPITHKPLLPEELVPDNKLRTAIMRFHIGKASQTQQDGAGACEEDLYDF